MTSDALNWAAGEALTSKAVPSKLVNPVNIDKFEVVHRRGTAVSKQVFASFSSCYIHMSPERRSAVAYVSGAKSESSECGFTIQMHF